MGDPLPGGTGVFPGLSLKWWKNTPTVMPAR
uniref:Uncharacterized protein n=1 Tax=Anguilla anguilla TaxID=7936 RepID=A0A0E9W6H0_ANGAN